MKRRLASLLVIAIVAGCASSHPVKPPIPPAQTVKPLGKFFVQSKLLGTRTLEPSVCTAGARQYFLGADLTDPGSDVVLRLVVDPVEGPAVRLFSSKAPFDESVVFHRSDCGVFHFSLGNTGWRVNDVRDFSVSLQLDCGREGERVTGSATAKHCH